MARIGPDAVLPCLVIFLLLRSPEERRLSGSSAGRLRFPEGFALYPEVEHLAWMRVQAVLLRVPERFASLTSVGKPALEWRRRQLRLS